MRVLVVLLLLFPLWLQAEDEFMVRAQFIDVNGQESESGVIFESVVGARVTLAVDILTSSWFTKAPVFSHLTIRDAINLKAETFATNFSERINGKNYAVQRREYTIFPQRDGQFVVDGIEVSVWDKADPAEAPKKRTLRSKPLLLMVKALPAVDLEDFGLSENNIPDGIHSLVATDVVLEQSYSSSLDDLKVGDLVERQIEVRAAGTLAMLIPPFVWPEVEGATQVSLSASVDDQTNRGEFVGIRRETRQYTLLEEGSFNLPAVELIWWDGQSWQHSEAPEYRLADIAAREGFALRAWSESFRAADILRFVSSYWLVLVCAFALLLGLIWLRIGSEHCRLSAALDRFYRSEKWLSFSLMFAVWFLSADQVVVKFYRWRNAGSEPLRPVPQSYEALWEQWCILGQQHRSANLLQRKQLALMVRSLRRDLRVVVTKDRRDNDGTSISATVSLQPLNPR